MAPPHQMPGWLASGIVFIFSNALFLGAAVAGLYFANSSPQNGTHLDPNNSVPFEEFSWATLNVFSCCLLVTGVLGICVGALMILLHLSRERPSPKRYISDTFFDILTTLYTLILGSVMVAAGISAGFCTYLYHTSNNVPSECPGQFEFNPEGTLGPLSQCSFDSTAYLLVHGATGSNQFAKIWEEIQNELGCCGYWCAGSNDSAVRGTNVM